MIHRLRKSLINIVRDSPFEAIVRRVYGAVSFDQGSKYDRQASKVIRRVLSHDSNCIDVGAYRGETLRDPLKWAPDGRHVAIDPIPENCRYISEKYPVVTVHHAAVSDTEGEAVFFCAMGRPARSSLKRQAYPDPDEGVREIRVPTRRLDTLVDQDKRVAFIKIDVEGAELLVLRGAEKLIRADRPVIIFEYLTELAESFDSPPGDVFDLVSGSYGMDLSSMERWLRHDSPYSRTEFITAATERKEFYFIAS